MEIKPLKSVRAFRSNRTIRRRQPSPSVCTIGRLLPSSQRSSLSCAPVVERARSWNRWKVHPTTGAHDRGDLQLLRISLSMVHIPRRLPRGTVEIDSKLEIVCSALIPMACLFHRTVNPQKPDQDWLHLHKSPSWNTRRPFVDWGAFSSNVIKSWLTNFCTVGLAAELYKDWGKVRREKGIG